MERVDLIEFGAASIETKGPNGPNFDSKLGQVPIGLNDD